VLAADAIGAKEGYPLFTLLLRTPQVIHAVHNASYVLLSAIVAYCGYMATQAPKGNGGSKDAAP